MHRSRVSSLVIDCAAKDYVQAQKFWSEALGKDIVPRDDRFSSLKGRIGKRGGVFVGFQSVSDEELGIHIDIETDDVEAEVGRLQKLGAQIKRRVRQHVVMQSPSGHAFCVIPVRRGDFPDGASEWS
jgi:predicted enzyme related to lactoylglutathione lyase